MEKLKTSVRPGIVLEKYYMEELGLTAYAVAKRINVPRNRITRLIRGETRITPDTAFRLGRLFGTTTQYWMNMQAHHDVCTATAPDDLNEIEPVNAAAA